MERRRVKRSAQTEGNRSTSVARFRTKPRERKSRRRSTIAVSIFPFVLRSPAHINLLSLSPFLPPSHQSRADDRAAPEDDGASYQLDMMRCLREVNADNNTVGWYQSTSLGAFQTAELADTFAAYASTIRRAVCIVVDPDAARGGGERDVF